MALAPLNNNNVSYLNYSSRSNVVENDKNIEKSSLKSDVIELNSSQNRSNLASNLSANITKLSSVATNKNDVNTQLDIINKIVNTVSEAQLSTNSFESLDRVQPQVQSMMTNYNELSKYMEDTQKPGEVPKSRAFFDGVLGSKPLSPAEIFKAVEKQRQMLSDSKGNLDSVEKEIFKDSMNIIKQERVVSQEKSPFKIADFSSESDNFTSQSVLSVSGSITETQVNVSNDISLKLLS